MSKSQKIQISLKHQYFEKNANKLFVWLITFIHKIALRWNKRKQNLFAKWGKAAGQKSSKTKLPWFKFCNVQSRLGTIRTILFEYDFIFTD